MRICRLKAARNLLLVNAFDYRSFARIGIMDNLIFESFLFQSVKTHLSFALYSAEVFKLTSLTDVLTSLTVLMI